ncbi:LysR family transcriptional regulator [Rhizobium laguerreae]|uniref:LysR family transcriptional regulator n=1 Tax=Rhizobium laguerreae TaxID=1076926 RepID=UPI001C9016DF|nr:LysR family transcriptional regulator [Rhizobium laguerreae]MBY3387309.1 LysR family transcriptional regulator [Rhizobium laguerreae]MBY3401059.1 LysR family transcriptional regulator [Rhizobium laguerreae]MBY3407997.1 LysR family transcriptional regulator [Rhizobium laguerreae]
MSLFRSMQVFVTTVQEGSMSAASGKLGMSPAMVGQHVAALEERLGTRLLNRTTRRQSLTDFGASYVEHCRDILERVAIADQDAEALQAEPRGKLKMTAPTTFGAEVLMPRLQRYRELAPGVTLDITLKDRNVDIVDEGFDIAFRIGELPDSRLIARRLAPYRMMICAAPDYLARRGNPQHPSDLVNHDAIGFAPAARSSWKLAKGDDRVEIAPQVSITVNSGQAVRMAAQAGLGVIMQPSILLSSDVEAGLLVQLFPDWQLRERPMSLVYHRDRRMTPRLRSIISFAISEFGATPERREDPHS